MTRILRTAVLVHARAFSLEAGKGESGPDPFAASGFGSGAAVGAERLDERETPASAVVPGLVRGGVDRVESERRGRPQDGRVGTVVPDRDQDSGSVPAQMQCDRLMRCCFAGIGDYFRNDKKGVIANVENAPFK